MAIDNLSFSADKDKITSIIGPNGAGKTTVFNCLTGFYKATAGSMFLNKENERLILRKFSDFKVAQKAGVARTFQKIRLFPQRATFRENFRGFYDQIRIFLDQIRLLRHVARPNTRNSKIVCAPRAAAQRGGREASLHLEVIAQPAEGVGAAAPSRLAAL